MKHWLITLDSLKCILPVSTNYLLSTNETILLTLLVAYFTEPLYLIININNSFCEVLKKNTTLSYITFEGEHLMPFQVMLTMSTSTDDSLMIGVDCEDMNLFYSLCEALRANTTLTVLSLGSMT